MYPEGSDSAMPPADDFGGSIQSKFGTHLEGLVPLILIIIIGFFLAVKFDVVDNNTPLLGVVVDVFDAGNNQTKMLIIGSTSQDVVDILNDNRNTIDYDIRTTNSLERNPKEIIANYAIVMLDQSEEASKEVSKDLGEAIQSFVKSGGKFILVKDSGIRRPDTYDVVGWKNTFGDIIPVECDRTLDNQTSCTNRILVQGKLLRQDESHEIMEGIDQFPADNFRSATFETFDVSLNGKEIAYIQSSAMDKKSFVGIAEKNIVIGKSIYFNYNPGKTRGEFESTLDYLS